MLSGSSVVHATAIFILKDLHNSHK